MTDPTPVEVSLTSEPDSISDLFMRDPKVNTEADWKRMVSHYRQTRKNLGAAPATKTKAKPAKADLSALSIEEVLGKLNLGSSDVD
jgi:hypothetical protein